MTAENSLQELAITLRVAGLSNQLGIHDPTKVAELKGIRVIDVGQGDCIGLLNQNSEVFCYVDFGGLTDHPDQGLSGNNPSAYRMPARFGNGYVSVILTHWDKDHYWSANKKNVDAQCGRWIVPRQHVSPQAVRFAAKLANARRWPESIGPMAVPVDIGASHRVVIRKCGRFHKSLPRQDRNLSGLAVTLIELSSGGVEEAVIILPGDCPFDRIPAPHPGVPIRGLVAYHHGSRAHWTQATSNSIANMAAPYEMVYSYGRNRYGHPDRSNYQPDWDLASSSTGAARAAGALWIDVTW